MDFVVNTCLFALKQRPSPHVNVDYKNIYKYLTVWVFCQDGVSSKDWFRLALLVDGGHLELVQVSRLEARGCGAGCCCCAGGHPLSAVNVHVSKVIKNIKNKIRKIRVNLACKFLNQHTKDLNCQDTLMKYDK